jgi:hypothetical protein
VEWPLEKPLQPKLVVKIKGCGQMRIVLRYENVPYFCFSCGRIGNAAMNCDEEACVEQRVRYGEELRASLMKWVREISLHQITLKAAQPLF